ncbi:hypothetical protein KY290_008007 [Solanum tuberosum]|uniref:Uncharacterized protein n=1 Tax=Solanum tuberosum TaxID=4113 RepID=A0ABQ7W8I2_SOLTU|nr:hypothetical protein KY290_008007 [Solanum tuberosum]
MQNHQVLLVDFPFNKMIEVSVVDNSGGIVVLWDDKLMELDKIAITEQEVHAMIKIKDTYFRKWLNGGDFNKLLNNADKLGGNPLNNSSRRDFSDVINY